MSCHSSGLWMWMCWQQQVTEGISVSLAQILDSQVTDGEPDDEIGEYTVALERGYGREKNMLDGLVAFDFCGSSEMNLSSEGRGGTDSPYARSRQFKEVGSGNGDRKAQGTEIA
ncbi:hypothetical protein BKA65DRAFT_541015 [Rhexocercosporidium sp. MPI-PUGE-AT-0058]|nr:hypothetical protein BKA65DRAFT_541015 [Rhexocercosporidium sp. MPI-PUGE-AT-0058]